MGKKYSEEELDFIKKNYSSMKPDHIAKKLNRTKIAILHVASKMNLVAYSELKNWTDEERKYIMDQIKNRSLKDIAKEFGVKQSSVYMAVWHGNRMAKEDLYVGALFGQLTVLSIEGSNTSTSKIICECQCSCGKKITTTYLRLKQGKARSCGCYRAKIRTRPPGYSSVSNLMGRFKRNAHQRGLSFDLSREDFESIISQNCYLCNTPAPDYNCYLSNDRSVRKNMRVKSQKTIERAWIKANSIDRVNNEAGYSVENCRAACINCNMMKLNHTKEEFIRHVSAIVDFQRKINGNS